MDYDSTPLTKEEDESLKRYFDAFFKAFDKAVKEGKCWEK